MTDDDFTDGPADERCETCSRLDPANCPCPPDDLGASLVTGTATSHLYEALNGVPVEQLDDFAGALYRYSAARQCSEAEALGRITERLDYHAKHPGEEASVQRTLAVVDEIRGSLADYRGYTDIVSVQRRLNQARESTS